MAAESIATSINGLCAYALPPHEGSGGDQKQDTFLYQFHLLALITFVKKSNQCFHIIILGTDRYGVYTAFLERIAHLRLPFLPPFLIGRAHTGGGTVYPLLLPGLASLIFIRPTAGSSVSRRSYT